MSFINELNGFDEELFVSSVNCVDSFSISFTTGSELDGYDGELFVSSDNCVHSIFSSISIAGILVVLSSCNNGI